LVPRLALLFWIAALASCAAPKPGPFYAAKAAPAPPGTLISFAPFNTGLGGASAYKVIYNSTDIHGASIPVSGVIFIPATPPPPGGRNVVAWAHPTTGVAPGCAPSLEGGGIVDSVPGLSDFIAAGDIVAATDYPGLGTPGVSPYLLGDGEARSIIDSVRGARALPNADMNGDYVVWGHSQGAQAVLFAGQIAGSYAPDLHLEGVAAAAPVTDLNGELTEPFSGDSGRLLAAYVYYTWSATYQVPMTTVVYPSAVAAVQNTASKCINSLGQGAQAILAASALNPVFLSHPPQSTPPWPALFDENSPGHAAPGAPLLIVQGTKDTTVEPHWTRSFAAKVCQRRESLDYVEVPGATHLDIPEEALPVVTNWIKDRFAGLQAADNCPS